jgi:hypothetical protein
VVIVGVAGVGSEFAYAVNVAVEELPAELYA